MWYYAYCMTRCCRPKTPPQAVVSPPMVPPPSPVIVPQAQPCPYPDLPTLNPSLIREDGSYIA